jgi:hypothetical protein
MGTDGSFVITEHRQAHPVSSLFQPQLQKKVHLSLYSPLILSRIIPTAWADCCIFQGVSEKLLDGFSGALDIMRKSNGCF